MKVNENVMFPKQTLSLETRNILAFWIEVHYIYIHEIAFCKIHYQNCSTHSNRLICQDLFLENFHWSFMLSLFSKGVGGM